jgi:hypothetical protein
MPVVNVISLQKRQKMQASGDYTVNAVGPENATPVTPLKPDWIADMVDGFIRDGWILPENRMAEIAAMQQGNRLAVSADLFAMQKRLDYAVYAGAWVSRVLDYIGDRPVIEVA